MSYSYSFPTSRLRPLRNAKKTPLVLIACGSFSPVTYLHLRMFEMARDHARLHSDFEVVGGYLSPVSDQYKKPGLAPGAHRFNMCQMACKQESDWLSVDPWEVLQPAYSKTADVLDHFKDELNNKHQGVEVLEEPGQRRPVRIMLLAGSDLIQTMSEPDVWAVKDLHHILGDYGCFIIERAESEIDQSIFSSSSVHSRSPLALYANNIYMVSQLIRNDVSSTKVRLFLKKDMSVMYLTPRAVVQYIQQHGLYQGRYHGEPGTDAAAVASSSASASTSTKPRSRPRTPVSGGAAAAASREGSTQRQPSPLARSSSDDGDDSDADFELMPVED